MFGFSEFIVHAIQVTGKNTCLITSCTCTDFNHSILSIFRISRNKHHPDIFLQFVFPGSEDIQFFFGHAAELLIFFIVDDVLGMVDI